MKSSPEKAVDMWINHPKLNPRYLIPALLRYNHSSRSDRASEVKPEIQIYSSIY